MARCGSSTPGLVDTGNSFFLLPHKNRLVAVTFVDLIFRNFAKNDDIEILFFHCGDELNGIDTWECHI